MADLSSAHRLLQAKCQLVRTIYIKRIKVFLFGHIINILLTELSRSVWEKLDLGRVYRPHCVRSVLTTSVKILPYRPPARLIRGKYKRAECEAVILLSLFTYSGQMKMSGMYMGSVKKRKDSILFTF